MKHPRPLVWLIAGLLTFAPRPLFAKPPAKGDAKPSAASPAPSATPDNIHVNPTAVWLLQQDGGKDAITLPLGEVVHAVTGRNILPFDPANPSDKAFLTRLSDVMDHVLPRLNRFGSSVQAAARPDALDEDYIISRIEPDIADAYSPGQGLADIVGRDYPSFRLMGTNGRPYYLSVVLYPPGKRELAKRLTGSTVHAFRLDPAEAGRIATDACCLLIGIEFERRPGGLAFLNWDVTDVTNVPVRAAITFQADGADVYHPGAVLTDGRKGSD